MADLGLGIVAVLPKEATILPVTTRSAAAQALRQGGAFTGLGWRVQPARGGALGRPQVARSTGLCSPRDRMTGRQAAPPALASVPAPMHSTASGQGQRRILIPTPERPPEPTPIRQDFEGQTSTPTHAEDAPEHQQTAKEREKLAREILATARRENIKDEIARERQQLPAAPQYAGNQPKTETQQERLERYRQRGAELQRENAGQQETPKERERLAQEIMAKARRANAAELVAEEKSEMEQRKKAEKSRADSRSEQKPDAQNRMETREERTRRFEKMMEEARRENAKDRERDERHGYGRGRGGGGMER